MMYFIDHLCTYSICIYAIESFYLVTIGKSIIEKLPTPVVPHKYIVSIRMFPNRKLLTALKSEECKVELIERDFEYLRVSI